MKTPKNRQRDNPEAKIQAEIVKMLRNKGWYVHRIHGSIYQSGLPDLYATHSSYGPRWIEVKLPNMVGSRFTAAQLDVFPKLEANGTHIWILTAATETEYKKLFNRSNFHQYRFIKDV